MPFASEATQDPLIGRVLKDAYRIVSRLGDGHSSTVYRGVQLAVGRDVAIKVLQLGGAALDDAAAPRSTMQFRREALATSRLRSPHCVQLIDFGETDDGLLFHVHELLRGVTLKAVLAAESPLWPIRAARLGVQIARGLAEAHANRIVHRELRPEHVYVCTYDGEEDFVKILGFGVARLADTPGGERVTMHGIQACDPTYMAPEQVAGERATAASDRYTLGVLLHELLTGRAPYSIQEACDRALEEDATPAPLPPLAVALGPDGIVDEWHALLAGLLDPEPAARPDDTAAVAAELAGLREAMEDHERAVNPAFARRSSLLEIPRDLVAPDTSQVEPLARLGASRGRWLALGVGAVAAAAVAVLGWQALGGGAGEGTGTVAIDADLRAKVAVVAVRAAGDEPAPTRPAAIREPAPRDERDQLAELAAEVPADAPPESAPAVARLELDSLPSGASVWRGERQLCVTPCRREVDAGPEPEELVLRRQGRREARIEVQLGAGATVTRTVRLARARNVAPSGSKSGATPKHTPEAMR